MAILLASGHSLKLLGQLLLVPDDASPAKTYNGVYALGRTSTDLGRSTCAFTHLESQLTMRRSLISNGVSRKRAGPRI